MARLHTGGSWKVGIKDNKVVYLQRLSEDGNRILDADLEPDEAREIAALLLRHADKISPPTEGPPTEGA